MKIMFDSNVWQKSISPEDYQQTEQTDCFEVINTAIIDAKITPYLSETIFTLELIRKAQRHSFFGDMKPNITFENEYTNSVVHMKITLGPNPKDFVDFKENPILEKYFKKAIKLGFKIVKFPRLGGVKNTALKNHIMHADEKTSNYMEEIETEISKRGAGYFWVEDLVKNCEGNGVAEKIKNLPVASRNKIKKAVAEWADGDSIACCIALKCDYFCTRDLAKGAGNKSVLSQNNLEYLNKKYNFKTISPEDLANVLKNKNY
jgi:hypothetical protein